MIAIIILNYNTPTQTIECMKSVLENTKLIDYKILIVDNNSSDNSVKIISENIRNIKNVELKISKANEGYSAGNNLALKELNLNDFSYFCILNSDVVLNNDAIGLMYDALRHDESIGCIGPSISNVSGDETQLLRKDFNLFYYFLNKRPFIYLSRFSKKFKTEYSYPLDNNIFKFYGMVYGCCFMISSSLFKEIGFFDENVFLYCEEWILGRKLKSINKYSAFLPSAKITHLHAISTSKLGRGFQVMHLNLSSFYYLKHYTKIRVIGLIFLYLQNCILYSLRAIYDKSFRKNLSHYFKVHTDLLIKKTKVKIR